MYSLSVKNEEGEALSLTHNPKYNVYKIDGLTPPNTRVSQSTNSYQDGTMINSTRLEARNIVIYMTIEGDVEANRINLYKYFPPKKTVTLCFANDSRNVCIQGTVEKIQSDLFVKKQIAQISLICPNPYFKALEDVTTSFSDVLPLFEFPFSIAKEGIEFSRIATNIRRTIINTGDADTGLIITLYAIGGSVVNPVIYDVLKRTHMRLNFTMSQSDIVTINTNVGQKSIILTRDGVDSNAMGYLSQDSNWLMLGAGDNVFAFDTDGVDSNIQIQIKTSTLYSGV